MIAPESAAQVEGRRLAREWIAKVANSLGCAEHITANLLAEWVWEIEQAKPQPGGPIVTWLRSQFGEIEPSW
jgi:hypothetical protein